MCVCTTCVLQHQVYMHVYTLAFTYVMFALYGVALYGVSPHTPHPTQAFTHLLTSLLL